MRSSPSPRPSVLLPPAVPPARRLYPHPPTPSQPNPPRRPPSASLRLVPHLTPPLHHPPHTHHRTHHTQTEQSTKAHCPALSPPFTESSRFLQTPLIHSFHCNPLFSVSLLVIPFQGHYHRLPRKTHPIHSHSLFASTTVNINLFAIHSAGAPTLVVGH